MNTDFAIIGIILFLVIIVFWLIIQQKKNNIIKLLYSNECPTCGNSKFIDQTEVSKTEEGDNQIYMVYYCENCKSSFNLDYIGHNKKIDSQHSVSYWDNNLDIVNPELKEANKELLSNSK